MSHELIDKVGGRRRNYIDARSAADRGVLRHQLRADSRSIGHRHRRCRELLISVVLLLVNVRSTEPKMADSGRGMFMM